jgi:hypothetical protein
MGPAAETDKRTLLDIIKYFIKSLAVLPVSVKQKNDNRTEITFFF